MKFLLIILSRILQLIFWCVGTSILFCGILFINGIIYLWAFNTKNWIAIEKEMVAQVEAINHGGKSKWKNVSVL